MANVFLVNPISSSRPTFSLGLATLDALAGEAGHFSAIIQPEFRVTDAVDPHYIAMEVAEALGPHLSRRRPGQVDVMGISVLSDTFAASRQIARWAKDGTLGRFTKTSFRPWVVAGGHLPTLMHEEVLRDAPCVDVVVRGEGESSFPALLAVIETHGGPHPSLREVPGLAWREVDRVVSTPPAPAPDLDAIPNPSPDYLEACFRRYSGRARPPVPLEVQRGCNGSCVFCDITTFYRESGAGGRVRFKSVPRVIEEMRPWVERDRAHFFLLSDSVLAEPAFLGRLVRAIDAEGFTARLDLSARPDDILRAREVLMEAVESEHVVLDRIEIGFEADSENALRLLGKGTTPGTNREVLALLDDLRGRRGDPMEIDYDFILLSHPDVTLEDLEANIRFAASHIPDDQEFSPAPVPYPRTPLWELLRRRGLKPDPDRGYVIPYEFADPIVQAFLERLSRMSRQELLARLRRLAARGDVGRRIGSGDW